MCLVVHVGLPQACSLRVAGELRVRLEAEFAGNGGFDLSLVAARAGEECSTELGLDEELGVKDRGG